MAQLDGKVAMITGASGGIAGGVIEKFAKEGAKLVLVDRDGERMRARVETFGDLIQDYLIIEANLGQADGVDQAVKQAEVTYGRIDALLHTVGGFAAGTPVHETELSVLEQQLFLNTQIFFLTLGRVARHMVEQGQGGSIVGILAKAALSGGKNSAAYTASKAAAMRIVESMALELKEHNIRVNGVMPSTADTQANRNAMPNADFSKWVTPAQIADAMFFLASDAAVAISGQAIGVYNKA